MCVISLLYHHYVLPQLRVLLVRSLDEHPLSTSNTLATLQSRYTCCGINGKDDYTKLTLDPLPVSCCRSSDCWHENRHEQSSNRSVELIHTNGCYPIVDYVVTNEVWILLTVAAVAALLQIFLIGLSCILCHRYRKFDDNPKFAINQLTKDTIANENINNNNNNNNLDGSSQTLDETLEITQI
jgi:hypothetical protein